MPGVLLLSGPPCSGKTSIGRLLPLPDRVRLEVDAVFDLLLPTSDRNRQDRMLAYDAAHALTRLALERGRGVLLECTYARREQRASLAAAMPPEAPLWVVEVHVTPDEAVERFRRRDQDSDLDDEQVRERAENFLYSDQALRLHSPRDGANEVLAWLRSGPRPVDRERWAAAGR